MTACTSFCLCPAAAAQGEPAPAPVTIPEPHPVEIMRREAGRLLPTVKHDEAKRFLLATSWLPVMDSRQMYRLKPDAKPAVQPDAKPEEPAPRRFISAIDHAALSDVDKAMYEPRESTASEYYFTRYGTPLAYVRALDLYVAKQPKGFAFAGKRVLDYGYGGVGHLRLLASLGADCVGVDVDPILPVIYSDPEDTGEIEGALFAERMPSGKLTLVNGSWPSDAKVAEKVGGGFDLILSKNTLKNGYINPAHAVDPRRLIQLGVSQEEFVKQLAAALNPGGYLLIYNLSPKQKEKPEDYIPWADGRCPFPRTMLESAGFEIVELDADDTTAARAVGRALEWDEGNNPMDVETDLFGHYTLLRKKVEPSK